jgi:hypothetical protein
MNRKAWSGNFCAQSRGAHAWLLSSAGPPRIDVHLSGVELPGDGTAPLDRASIDRIEIRWVDAGAEVALTQGGSIRRIGAGSAFVLEPQPDLYRALPLEAFSAKSRAFWKRIFLLVRIPGGGRLLGYIARRARA